MVFSLFFFAIFNQMVFPSLLTTQQKIFVVSPICSHFFGTLPYVYFLAPVYKLGPFSGFHFVNPAAPKPRYCGTYLNAFYTLSVWNFSVKIILQKLRLLSIMRAFFLVSSARPFNLGCFLSQKPNHPLPRNPLCVG